MVLFEGIHSKSFLQKVSEGIQVQQGIIGRILDFGSIIISGTGGLRDSFHKIAAPLELRKNAQEWFAFVEESKINNNTYTLTKPYIAWFFCFMQPNLNCHNQNASGGVGSIIYKKGSYTPWV